MSWDFMALLFIFGLVWGSFLNVCIYRIPLEESIVFPNSRCTTCKQDIVWYDNIPVISWLWLRGQCRHCKESISPVYPIIELITAILTWATISRYGLTPTGVAVTVFGYALLVLTVIDLYHYILPDVITLPGIVVGLILTATPWFGPPVLASWQDALIGVGVGGGGLWLFGWLFKRIAGKDGMGFGDVKLTAMVGAWLGWQALPFTIFAAALLGSVAGIAWIVVSGRDRSLPIPFGPYLALGAWGYLYFGSTVYAWYLGRLPMMY